MASFSDDYQLRGHVVPGRTIDSIRGTASTVRQIMKMKDRPPDLAPFLESLMDYGITYDVIEDHDFTLFQAGVEAVCIPEQATIALTAETYRAARRNDPRTRFTIFHELGHFVLSHSKALGRKNVVPKPWLDSEWQADQFAAEITMDLDVLRRNKLKTPTAIAHFCGVSVPAASYRLNQLKRKGLL